MPQISVEAPAKLNLHLHILNKQSNGYHELESLFLALGFGDTILCETCAQSLSLEIIFNWQITGNAAHCQPNLSFENNSIRQAVTLFRDRSGYDEGLKITVNKRIPLGSGLGGGSSNAASTLIALNQLAANSKSGFFNDSTLADMGFSLGSDVPFFFNNSSMAWVSGFGEKIQTIQVPESLKNLSFVLVYPGFPSNTAKAYRLFDNYFTQRRKGAKKEKTFLNDTVPLTPLRLCERYLNECPPCKWPFFNDFLPVFLDQSAGNSPSDGAGTVYKQILSDFMELGAEFTGLSGSGSACFGVFSDHKQAEMARYSLSKQWPCTIETFMLARLTVS